MVGGVGQQLSQQVMFIRLYSSKDGIVTVGECQIPLRYLVADSFEPVCESRWRNEIWLLPTVLHVRSICWVVLGTDQPEQHGGQTPQVAVCQPP